MYSFLPTIRERNCLVLKDDRIWAKREMPEALRITLMPVESRQGAL